jgi:hypothetical protein
VQQTDSQRADLHRQTEQAIAAAVSEVETAHAAAASGSKQRMEELEAQLQRLLEREHELEDLLAERRGTPNQSENCAHRRSGSRDGASSGDDASSVGRGSPGSRASRGSPEVSFEREEKALRRLTAETGTVLAAAADVGPSDGASLAALQEENRRLAAELQQGGNGGDSVRVDRTLNEEELQEELQEALEEGEHLLQQLENQQLATRAAERQVANLTELLTSANRAVQDEQVWAGIPGSSRWQW